MLFEFLKQKVASGLATAPKFILQMGWGASQVTCECSQLLAKGKQFADYCVQTIYSCLNVNKNQIFNKCCFFPQQFFSAP